jgi:hypothetical protein
VELFDEERRRGSWNGAVEGGCVRDWEERGFYRLGSMVKAFMFA